MRYLKTFESATEFNPVDVISKYWEVDFDMLKDMMSSLALTYDTHGFDIFFYMVLNEENCSVIQYEGNEFKKGPWWDNLLDIMEVASRGHNKVEPKIEFWVDIPNDHDGFVRDMDDFIADSGIPYHSSGFIELSDHLFFALRYEGKTEAYSLDESSAPDPEAFVVDKWNVDPYEFRDIVTATLEGFDEYEFELEFSIIYHSSLLGGDRHHLIKFEDSKLVWNTSGMYYDLPIYLNLINDVPDRIEYCISLSLPIDRTKDNVDFVKQICAEFSERLGLWGSEWSPTEILDVMRGSQYLTMIGFVRKGKSQEKNHPYSFEGMRYLKTFESHSSDDVLIIVDVQKSFSKYFTDAYVSQLNDYCRSFGRVYQIWDNHVEGKNVDKDYLYDEDPEAPMNGDLYHFPNQADLIEKRYNYDVDADFYRKILDNSVYEEIKSKEKSNSLVKGDFYPTKEGTLIIFVGNNHRWYHMPKKLHELFVELNQAQSVNESRVVKDVILVGGADRECLDDVETAAKVMGVRLKRNRNFIYSATNCPIK